jgi:hypothetical protein
VDALLLDACLATFGHTSAVNTVAVSQTLLVGGAGTRRQVVGADVPWVRKPGTVRQFYSSRIGLLRWYTDTSKERNEYTWPSRKEPRA